MKLETFGLHVRSDLRSDPSLTSLEYNNARNSMVKISNEIKVKKIHHYTESDEA